LVPLTVRTPQDYPLEARSKALESAGVSLGSLDRVEPPSYTLLTEGASLRVVRVREEFTIEEEVIPFERQVLQSESLSDQQKLLVQTGVNGLREITYRRVSENGVEVSNTAVKASFHHAPRDMMVGVRTPFTPVESQEARLPVRQQCLDDGWKQR
jgi:uncharacterized protein YabE (DUF348 family)